MPEITTEQPELKFEYTIGGKQVVFKRKLALRDHDGLIKALHDSKDGDLRSNLPVLQSIIERWQFDGDPADLAAYEDIDLFELGGLLRAVNTHVQARMAALDPN